jgi:NADPH:quinone reductase-like Zn-dependent oxidoreductase
MAKGREEFITYFCVLTEYRILKTDHNLLFKQKTTMGLLDGKTAIVTGGSRGIGRAIVDAFASEGASVAFTYLSSREKAEALAGEWQAKGTKRDCMLFGCKLLCAC